MTVEELEILVTARVEEAMKEIQKIMPELQKLAKQAQEAFSKVDMKKVKSQVQQSVYFVKKKVQDLKKSTENNEIAIKVTNKEAQKQVDQVKKSLDSLKKQTSSWFDPNDVSGMSITGLDLKQIKGYSKEMQRFIGNMDTTKLKEVKKSIEDIFKGFNNMKEAENISEMKISGIRQISGISNKKYTYNEDATQKANSLQTLNIPKTETSKINQMYEQWGQGKLDFSEIQKYKQGIVDAKGKMSGLKQEINSTVSTQNKLSVFFNTLKGKIGELKPALQKISAVSKTVFGTVLNVAKKAGNGIKNIFKSSHIDRGLKSVLRYAGALLSIRGIYGLLRGSAQAWLSSQNAGAQQLNANINYMKYALGSALAPVIQFVTSLVYQLMKAIQSVAYALTGVNIFAKASASSMKSAAGSAKKAKEETKQLAGVHDEINNISSNKNSDSGGSGGGATPSFDLSGMDKQLSPFAQKLYDFFKPLKESWDKYGANLIAQLKITANQVGNLISSVWGSVEKIIVNGTVYRTLELILAIIGNIAQAFANAWNYNGNGDAIVQNLANAFNNLLTAINNVAQSESFQEFLNNCSDKLRKISEKLSEIDWQPLIDALTTIGQSIGTIALDILSNLVDIFKWLVEHPMVAEILLSIAIAIGVVSAVISIISTAMTVWTTVMTVLTAVSAALEIGLAPLIGIIIGIIAVIALIVLAIMNWDKIVKALKDTWEWIKQKAQEIWSAIGEFFQNLWQNLKDTIVNKSEEIKTKVIDAWNNIKQKAQEIWENIKKTITEKITNLKTNISNTLNNIKTTWSNIWYSIKTVTSNVWNGIWSTIKGVINKVLGGIESFVNGTINGINTLLSGISKVASAVGSLIGLGPISLQLSTISLPRLAKGGVLTQETAFIGGEYSGARSNPEIVTPQSILRETFEDVLSRNNSNNQQNIELSVYVGNTKLGQILLDDLRNMKRRTGKDIEALVGG